MVDTVVSPAINSTLEEAIKQHDATDPGTLRIFTDGSGIDGHVGAAAVAPSLQLSDSHNKRVEYMGALMTTVYAAELRGLVLAFQIVLDVHAVTKVPGRCTIFTDNQAAVQEIANPKCPSEQCILVEAIHSRIRAGWSRFDGSRRMLESPVMKAADRAAKEAAGQGSTTRTSPKPHQRINRHRKPSWLPPNPPSVGQCEMNGTRTGKRPSTAGSFSN